MKSTGWFGLTAVLVLGATAVPSLVGCGGSKTMGTGGSGTTTATNGSTSASSTKTSAAVTVGSGSTSNSSSTGSGQMNHSFDTAIPVMLGASAMPTTYTLADPMTTDYYSFTGKKGDRFIFQATAQGLFTGTHDPNDPTVIDTVITLYMPDKTTVWASDDDDWPRTGTDSILLSELPADGTYYFTVQDCNGYAAMHTGTGIGCAPAGMITTFDYQVFVDDLTAAGAKGETVGANGAPKTVTYTPNTQSPGNSFFVTLDGDVSAAADVHSFTFTPTATTFKADPAARPRAYFWVQPIGATDGDGSAVNVTLTAKDSKGNIVAQGDQQYFTNGDDPNNGAMQFAFPLDDQFANAVGSAFTLDVGVSGTAAPAAPKNFYIVQHFAGSFDYGSKETKETALTSGLNDIPANAETLTMPNGVKDAYFADGNIASATDVDYWSMNVPAGLTKNTVGFSCTAARGGSGLLNFTGELLTNPAAPGTPASIVTIGPETANPTKDLQGPTMGTAIPTGTTSILLKTSATGQANNWLPAATTGKNGGTFYQCSVVFQ